MEIIARNFGLDTRARLERLITDSRVQTGIMVLILVNAITLGLETMPLVMSAFGDYVLALDRLILSVFVVEIFARIYVHRANFFRDPWSIFDLLVVGIALLPATGQFAVLRALRVLRVMRLLSIVPSMRRVVGALLASLPGLASIVLVLLVVFYVSAVIATNLFGAAFPDWFGSLGASLYTLFQVMTLESWSMGIARPVMEAHPFAWAFFIPFILIATFTMLNLFIAIIVNAMQTFTEVETRSTVEAVDRARSGLEAGMHEELQALRGEVRRLRELLEHQQPTG